MRRDIPPKPQKPVAGDIYKHHSGEDLYRVESLSLLSGGWIVNYRCISNIEKGSIQFARHVENFNGFKEDAMGNPAHARFLFVRHDQSYISPDVDMFLRVQTSLALIDQEKRLVALEEKMDIIAKNWRG